jgi:hypothetical protein
MNRKQRMKNRSTALTLHYACPPTYRCERCGEKTHQAHFGGGVVNGEFVGAWSCKPRATK